MQVAHKDMTPAERAGLEMRRRKYLGVNADGSAKTAIKGRTADGAPLTDAEVIVAEDAATDRARHKDLDAAVERYHAGEVVKMPPRPAPPPAPAVPAPIAAKSESFSAATKRIMRERGLTFEDAQSAAVAERGTELRPTLRSDTTIRQRVKRLLAENPSMSLEVAQRKAWNKE